MTASSRPIGAPDGGDPPAAGVWTLADDRLIIAEREGPATIVVPTEPVRLLAVDLPLATRAKRLEALPFAVEDLIAEPVESVHLALGAEVAPKRYLVGVVRHERMAAWVDAADEAGLGHAAIVPDALALPRPADGEWSVDLADARVLVRAGDGTGFAIPPALLEAAWQAAGRPAARSYGAPLPAAMRADGAAVDPAPLAERLLAPALDLRQGVYARRRVASSNFWRRLGWVAALGVAAHVVIATADTVMLRAIADRREADTRALAMAAAPGANLGDDLAAGVADLLPVGSSAPPDALLPLLGSVSSALAPLGAAITVRAIAYQGDTLTFDMDGSDPGAAARIDAALRGSQVRGSVARSPDGTLRVTASSR